MNYIDKSYRTLVECVYNSETVKTRNSETRRMTSLAYTFQKTPLVSLRRTSWKNALREMEWFLSGSNDIQDLHVNVRKWWEPWVDADGLIQNNYSKQFREFHGKPIRSGDLCITRTTDQIKYLIENIKDNPFSRRHVISTWNISDMLDYKTKITNCHGSLIQCFATENSLSMTMYQRSADLMVGVPHNWIQYWAFLMYLAHQTNKSINRLDWIGGDIHIYKEHYDMVEKILDSTVKIKSTPELKYNPSCDTFKADDFTLEGEYKPIFTENLPLII